MFLLFFQFHYKTLPFGLTKVLTRHSHFNTNLFVFFKNFRELSLNNNERNKVVYTTDFFICDRDVPDKAYQ